MYTITHAIFGYFFLLLVVRVLSRRPGGQLTPFEFVIVFLIGGLIITATVGDDKSATNCILAIITIGLMHRLTAQVRARFSGLSHFMDGVPIVLLNRGRWHTQAMDGMRLKDDDVMAAARTRGMRDMSEIRYAVLERVGTISILSESDSKVRQEEIETAGNDAGSKHSE
ncbi:DUF421 domain-containing protein [Acidipila sp. EB88]|uniref:DUF421 domain-containing protein n=1 Tax=Acidipila sp. EB88 TaxID=2305226 RepID=UPI000F5F288B|nr:YetF domain-containing protein [Acidipila sp. EB88]RRA48723.1 DUF421 domain-containing protein [Acidipila sp. EB88]